ncbi:MAG TPA: 4-hydroxy-tetrahydrodipicolinate synthase [Candidatus Choladousia intestinavium]|uniref:4-hydroxy-tetrahydrodipicolinate synthase n=1 Tax=Candidatus Choladousia intestinavium TaxID=2840727 RepID=A0A9D1ACT6_9FIRM|nr:4-hydroxy-tetrahydrodipicolinate synthase [Candidatus Choladousia intestinavium]
MKIEGIITPIVTPFYDDAEQNINYEATKDLIDHLIDHGVKGIFILGSNGEFHVIDEDEKIAFAKKVIEIVDKRVPVYVGTGACSTKATVRLSKKMEELGADALSVITPYFLKPTNENLYAHYKEVAESVSLPIILYNIPKATGCPLDPELVDRLADLPNIAGIKDSSGNLETLNAYAEIAKKKDFSLLVGSDSKISYAYGIGAVAAVAGTSNVIVDVLVGLDKALRQGDTETAEKLQKDIDVLRGVLGLGTVPSVMKRATELAGIAKVGPARKPVQKLGQEDDEKIKTMLKYYHLYE